MSLLVWFGLCKYLVVKMDLLILRMSSPEVSVKEDVEYLRNGPFFKGAQILGFVQDTKTGVLKEVVGI